MNILCKCFSESSLSRHLWGCEAGGTEQEITGGKHELSGKIRPDLARTSEPLYALHHRVRATQRQGNWAVVHLHQSAIAEGTSAWE